MKERFIKLKIELNKLAKVKKEIFYNKVNKKQLIEEEKSGGKSLLPNNESNENNNKDHFYYLNLKFNILNNTLRKLTLIIQNQINENNDEINNFTKFIKDTKSNVKKELSKDEKNIENSLQHIKLEYNNYIQNNNNIKENPKIKLEETEYNYDKEKTKLGELINLLDTLNKKEENNFINIKKDLNSKIEKINIELKNERKNINIINNPKVKKSFDNINNELDKGKSYEYLKRNEYKETINSILNDILAKLELEK